VYIGLLGEHELARVEELGDQALADLEDALVEGRVFSSRLMGVTTLPLLFDIFLRSGSRIQPEIATCFQGMLSSWSRALAMV
jgi:hypothetical protein